MIKGQFRSNKNNKNIIFDFIIPFFIFAVIVYAIYNSIGFSGADSVSKSLMDRFSDSNKTLSFK